MNFSVQAMALSFILFLGYHSIKASTSTDSKISKIEDRKTEFRYDGERSDYIMTKSSTRKKLEIDSRIIGGREVSAHTFPYVASLYIYNFDDKAVFCGGSLISLRLVLTAAHCPDGAYYIDVLLGAHNIRSIESSRINYRTKKWFIHEDWTRDTLKHDIAIIKLPERVELNDFISIVSFAKKIEDFSEENGLCLGWGKINDGSASPVLRSVDLLVISNKKCTRYKIYENVVSDSQFCTSGNGIVGSCNGDSGGPFIINGTLVGLVSFGINDCNAGYPSIYTKVAYYKEWIERILRTNKSVRLIINTGILFSSIFIVFLDKCTYVI